MANYLDIRQSRYKSLSNVLLLELSSSITRLGYQLVTLSESVWRESIDGKSTLELVW